MAALYRHLWWFFGGAAVGFFIATSQADKCFLPWLLAGGIVCAIMAIPSLLQNIRYAKMESLAEKIMYQQHEREWVTSIPEQEELRRRQEETFQQWLVGRFLKKP